MSATTTQTDGPAGPKVLVIAGDPHARLMLCGMVRGAGGTPIDANNGYWGLKRFKRDRPRLVFVDAAMPHLEGLVTMVEIRAADPEARIVAISADRAVLKKEYPQMAEAIGALRTLRKPFNPEEIRRLFTELALAAPG